MKTKVFHVPNIIDEDKQNELDLFFQTFTSTDQSIHYSRDDKLPFSSIEGVPSFFMEMNMLGATAEEESNLTSSILSLSIGSGEIFEAHYATWKTRKGVVFLHDKKTLTETNWSRHFIDLLARLSFTRAPRLFAICIFQNHYTLVVEYMGELLTKQLVYGFTIEQAKCCIDTIQRLYESGYCAYDIAKLENWSVRNHDDRVTFLDYNSLYRKNKQDLKSYILALYHSLKATGFIEGTSPGLKILLNA